MLTQCFKKKKKKSFLFIGPDCALYYQTIESYNAGIAPGTLANRLRQAKSYVRFSVLYNIDPLSPSHLQLCMYGQFLKNTHPCPQTIKNYISGAKTWVAEHGGDIQAFASRELDQITKGFVKMSSHVPKRAFPLDVCHLYIIADYVNSNPVLPVSVLPCIIIGFKCFLRSSNLLSPSMQVWGGPHTLLAKDIILSYDCLTVSVSSTKTKWDNKPEVFSLEREPDSRLCPVLLWSRYSALIRPSPFGPAFLTNEHLPLTARHVVGVMRAALAAVPHLDTRRVSLHSLRRGATQDAVDKGVCLNQIKTLGLWKSDSGVKPYLTTHSHKFNPSGFA